MNIHSLTSKITVIFALAFLSVCAFFVFYITNTQNKTDKQVLLQYEQFANYFHDNKIKPKEVEKYLESFGFKNERNARFILGNGIKVGEGLGYECILYEKNYYYHVQIRHFRRLFLDRNTYKSTEYEYLAFAFVLLLLVLVYLWLLRSLKPLHVLKENIIKFADGDMNVNCASLGKDEIALVSNEFDAAVGKINLLLSSRQLFLRTVMHELKTPIAKGRIVSELVDDEVQKSRLIFLFEKLDFLINDFAKIEEIVSNNYEVKKHKYRVSLLVDNAIEMLLLDNNTDKMQRKTKADIRIDVDFELMSMVIKNLIDNALKYSDNAKVELREEEKELLILSKGKPLSKPLDTYFKPFHNEADLSKQGMGLGLYIVKSVLDMHSMHLEYSYIDGKNIFKIIY
ncbi:MAG: sensor histidine kinase [Epsilonproteobacteria bacterium]|nr:MAG: sensor histidine kinase [Campylobacterota bacterium]